VSDVAGGPQAPSHRARGIDLVAYTDVAGSPVFKLAMQVVADRWYLYATHFWEPQISVIEVTDPTRPQLVAAIDGPEHTATWQVQVADGLMVQGMEHRPVPWGGDPNLPGDEGVRIFDVRDPHQPVLLSHWRTGDNGVHRSHYTGGRYVHVAAHQPGSTATSTSSSTSRTPGSRRSRGGGSSPSSSPRAAGRRPSGSRCTVRHTWKATGPTCRTGRRAW
jgi:hypothetical protein